MIVGGLVARYAMIPVLVLLALLMRGQDPQAHLLVISLGLAAGVLGGASAMLLHQASQRDRLQLLNRLEDMTSSQKHGVRHLSQLLESQLAQQQGFREVLERELANLRANVTERNSEQATQMERLAGMLERYVQATEQLAAREATARRSLAQEFEQAAKAMREVPRLTVNALAPVREHLDREAAAYRAHLAASRQQAKSSHQELQELWTRLVQRL